MYEENTPIYFSKILFTQWTHQKNYTYILLNLEQKEFSVQKYNTLTDPRAIYTTDTSYYFKDGSKIENIETPAVKVCHSKNNFNPSIFPEEGEQNCIFSYGTTMNTLQVEELKSFCNALEFQPFSQRDEQKNNLGICYRDEYSMCFDGFTNSPVPYMHIDMTIFHSNYPTEILWEKVYMSLIHPKKKLRRIVIK